MEETAETSSSTKEKMVLLKPENNDSDDCEAGPSKRSKIDEPIFKEVNFIPILNCLQSIDQIEVEEYPIIKDCCNSSNTYAGNVTNSPITNINIYGKHNSIIFEDKTKSKKAFPFERFSEDQSLDEETSLVLVHGSMLQIIPKVSRYYKKLVSRGYHCMKLSPDMHQMLKDLSQNVTDLTLDCCEFDIIALIEYLRELPLLESLKINVVLTIGTHVDFPMDNLPKLLQLKDFKIKANDKLNEIFDIIGSASNIQSISLFDAKFDSDLIDYLNKLKKLIFISVTICLMEKPSQKTNLPPRNFNFSVKLLSENYSIFDCLKNLRTLEILKVNGEFLEIIYSKSATQITNEKTFFNYESHFDEFFYLSFFIFVNSFYQQLDPLQFTYRIYKTLDNTRDEEQIELKFSMKTEKRNEELNMIYFKISPSTVVANEINESFPKYRERMQYENVKSGVHSILNITENCNENSGDCSIIKPTKADTSKILNGFETRLKKYRTNQ